MKTEIAPFYQKRSEEFIDMMFDNGYFTEEIKRKDLRALEEYFAYVLQSSVDSAIKSHDLLRKIRER